jgi:hypothetical protein
MNLIWLKLIAVLIAVSSLVVDLHGPVSYEGVNLDSETQLKSLWEVGTMFYAQSERHSKTTHVIAQDFLPIVVLAEPTDAKSNFHHYLPLYDLHRQKKYFLLI